MNYRQLGRSELKISAIGFGCWAIGGHKWGAVDDSESVNALKYAAESGVNFFDTADFYGFGHSEEVLARAFKNSDRVIITTKGGLRWNSKGKIFHDLSKKHLVNACNASLQRLKRETIELYQLHWPDPETPFGEALETLDSLVTDGKIRYGGACNLNRQQLEMVRSYPWFISYQDKLNLFNREVQSGLLPYCLDNEIGFIAYQPLFKGMLTGKFKSQPIFEKGDHRKYRKRFNDRFNEYKGKIDKLEEIALSNGLTVTQLSLAYVMHAAGVSSVIPGAKNTAQVIRNIEAVKVERGLIKSLDKEISEVLSCE